MVSSTISSRIEQGLKAKLLSRATDQGKSVSQILTDLISNYLQENPSSNPGAPEPLEIGPEPPEPKTAENPAPLEIEGLDKDGNPVRPPNPTDRLDAIDTHLNEIGSDVEDILDLLEKPEPKQPEEKLWDCATCGAKDLIKKGMTNCPGCGVLLNWNDVRES